MSMELIEKIISDLEEMSREINVFDRTAEGRSIKNLMVVDDATHEAVAIVPGRAKSVKQKLFVYRKYDPTFLSFICIFSSSEC